jgi:hypothetical protein
MTMILKRFFSSKLITAFVSVVLLVNLLMPAIAGATTKRDKFSTLLSVICTSSGVKIVGANGNQSAPIQNRQDTVHCAFCVVGGSSSLPTQATSFVTFFQGSFVFETASIYPLPLNAYWPSASPRGPPATA